MRQSIGFISLAMLAIGPESAWALAKLRTAVLRWRNPSEAAAAGCAHLAHPGSRGLLHLGLGC